VSHVLWNCPAATDVWSVSPPRIQKCIVIEDSFLNIFSELHGHFEEDEMQLIALTARLIWLRSNAFVFEGRFTPPLEVVRHARD
jgi:hypothetical protein